MGARMALTTQSADTIRRGDMGNLDRAAPEGIDRLRRGSPPMTQSLDGVAGGNSQGRRRRLGLRGHPWSQGPHGPAPQNP
jgi:hypothetical protein